MTTVAIIGSGLIGRAWAIVFARAGYGVRLWDHDVAVRAKLPELIRAMTDACGASPEIIGHMQICDTMAEAVEGADLAQENGPEKLDIKRAIFADLDRVAAPHTILASSSSTFVASRFADGLAGIARIIVAHPVNPPHLIPVVELCPAPQTDAAVMERAEQLYRQAGQVPVRLSREVDGFVLNRLQAVLLAEALRLVEEGIVSVKGLDDTMRHGLGRRWAFMGPLQTIFLNAPNGIADYMSRYGPPMGALADTAGRGEAFSDNVAETLAKAFPDPAAIPELSRWRDGELAALDQHLRNRANRDED